MSRIRSLRCANACMLLVLGCSGGERPKAEPAPEPPPPATVAQPAPAAPPAVEPEPSSDELPVEEDFEAEAEQQITPDNLRAQLDAIEKEIGPAK